MSSRTVRATRAEANGPLPGDDLIPKPVGSLTHAITIRRPARDVWPWLAQMGAGSRAGWYSYDTLDNGGRSSARRIVPELQSLAVGMIFPAVPGATDGFTLLDFVPEGFLVLGWVSPDRQPVVTWAFVLSELHGATRLIVRARGGPGYSFRGLPPAISQRVIRLLHFLMQRRQLIGVATRVERSSVAAASNTSSAEREGIMRKTSSLRTAAVWCAVAVGAAAGIYTAYVARTWQRFGRITSANGGDELLNRFMLTYEIVERHAVLVQAPAAVTLEAASQMEAFQLPLVRAVIKGRELVLGARADDRPRPRGLLAEAQAMGWGVLAEEPGHEVVVGAVTKPWEPHVTFRSLLPEAFTTFDEPGYVKMAWTLRADPIDDRRTMFRTETRAVATDSAARAKFRRYWSVFSPGIKVIRHLALRELKSVAERGSSIAR